MILILFIYLAQIFIITFIDYNLKGISMKQYLLFLIVIFFFLVGCKEESPFENSNSSFPYSGSWQVIFTGDYTGSGTMNIDTQGKFAVSVILKDDFGSFMNTVEGSVNTSGNMNAAIFYSGEKIGEASGTFTQNSGSGIWITDETSGTWSATKK